MDTLEKANIFFFISSIAVVLVTLAILVVAYFAVRALRKAEDAADDVRTSSVFRLLFRKRKIK